MEKLVLKSTAEFSASPKDVTKNQKQVIQINQRRNCRTTAHYV